MNKFLQKYGGKNIYTLNSLDTNNGIIDYDDRKFLTKILSEDIDVELQGGYICGCLDGAIESFNDIKKYARAIENGIKIKPYIDLIPSTSPWIQNGDITINNGEEWNEFISGVNLKRDPQDNFPTSFNSVSDAITWLKSSNSYKNFENSNYRTVVAELYKKEYNIDAILDKIDDLNGDVKYGDTH